MPAPSIGGRYLFYRVFPRIPQCRSRPAPCRLGYSVTVNGTPVFRGIQSGYPTTLEYVVGQNSSYTDALKTLPQLGIMMTFAEVEFIKAELALKGFTTGKTPKAHYEAGIASSMTQWGTTLPAGFLTQKGVAFDAAATPEKQLEQIMLQKYYAFFFVDYQSWFEKRRTGYRSYRAARVFPPKIHFQAVCHILPISNP